VNFRLDSIGDEIINNLTMKKVVCPSVVWNVGITGEHQINHVSTPRVPYVLGG
jgi:hypothetical protein